MQTSVVIPALNEQESIGSVLAAVPYPFVNEVIVVDGGSSDGTAEVAQAAGAQVVVEVQRGYGRACSRGMNQAHGDILVFLDADGADDPAQLPDLIKPIQENQAEMVLGSRLLGEIAAGAMPWHQRFGNWLAAGLIRQLYGLPVTDLSPYRAVLRENLLSLNMSDMTFGWPTEMIVKGARAGWRIMEMPVSYSQRSGGRSKISGTLQGTVYAAYHILAVIFRYARWVPGHVVD